MPVLGFDDWKCVCKCVNYEFRKRCRYCNETREFAELADRIAAKSKEIEAIMGGPWPHPWGYQKPSP